MRVLRAPLIRMIRKIRVSCHIIHVIQVPPGPTSLFTFWTLLAIHTAFCLQIKDLNPFIGSRLIPPYVFHATPMEHHAPCYTPHVTPMEPTSCNPYGPLGNIMHLLYTSYPYYTPHAPIIHLMPLWNPSGHSHIPHTPDIKRYNPHITHV